MKSNIWNLLTVLLLVGTVTTIVIYGVLFLLPGNMVPSIFKPVNVPEQIVLPTATETPFVFPATWTKSPIPTITLTSTLPAVNTSTVAAATNTSMVLFTATPTATETPLGTLTPTKTNTLKPGVYVNTATKSKTPTKTKKPTATKTKDPNAQPCVDAVDDELLVDVYPASADINVVANDIGNDLYVVAIKKDPPHGSVSIISETTIRYKPDQGYAGMDMFTYRMSNPGGCMDNAVVTVLIDDGSGNLPPTNIDLAPSTILENEPANTEIGTLSTDDAMGGPFIYRLVAGAGDTNNDLVTIKQDGLDWKVYSKAVINREATSSLKIRVLSIDPGFMWYSEALTITVGDENDTTPRFTSAASKTGKRNTAFTFTVTTTDDDLGDTLALTLIEGTPPGWMTVGPDTGGSIALTGTPDVTGVTSLKFRVTDAAGHTKEQTLTITITN